jgi:AcrR family transcriptional regulator
MAVTETTESGGAWDRRRIQVSLRIERAALELLSEKGVDDVRVEQIARAAGISVRTFFRYFRNPRDVLTAVPLRESRRMCRALLERPAGESLLDGFHAWFREIDDGRDISTPIGALEVETLALWAAIVRSDPDRIQAESRALTALSTELEEVLRQRIGFTAGEEEKVGVLAAAFAAVIWYVFTRTVGATDPPGLRTRLDEAFELLGHLHSATTV